MFAMRARKPEPALQQGALGTVLLVDDDPCQRIELCHGLVRAGAHVVQRARGDEVLDAIEQIAPHLVILDVRLPGRNGDELARDIAERHPGTRVLLMTGDPTKCAEVNAAHLPVFAVLEKPVPLRALIRFVTSALKASPPRQAPGMAQRI